MTLALRRLVQTSALTAAVAVAVAASPASAATTVVPVGQTFTAGSPVTFSFGDSTFTFTGTGDFFAPTAVSTGGTGQINTIFGQPTSYFVDRGTVTIGSSNQFAAFGSPTTVPFSNGNNFFGLRATSGANVFYGFAFTTNNVLNSFGFENVPGQAVTATTRITAAVPEPGTWMLMLTGFGAVGVAMRRRRRELGTAVAA